MWYLYQVLEPREVQRECHFVFRRLNLVVITRKTKSNEKNKLTSTYKHIICVTCHQSTMLSRTLFTNPALNSSSSRVWRKIITPSSSILGSSAVASTTAATTTATVGTNHYQSPTNPPQSSTKWFSTSTKTLDTAKFDLTGSFLTHNLDIAPSNTVEATKDELLDIFQLMYTMRRMEITCDNEYKARAIRGFCHLYDGQEAVAAGIDWAFTNEDSWITSYRCHCVALIRGGSVSQVVGELFGTIDGLSKGKGGSMHFYNKKHNFYGGQGIVGAQVPVGAGLAFANKYNAVPGEKMNVAIACYGDGAANQGQIWEAANMSALWKLPMIFCIENNHYGMGTSIDRHSSIQDYYKMGNAVPGIRIDGMNVLAVREGIRFAKEWCGSGNGPMYVEMMTYRYHGHSMSDPGTTYRNREEIAFTRSTRDPLEYVKKIIIENKFADEIELKDIEKRIRKDVQKEVMKVKDSVKPTTQKELISHIFTTSLEPQAESEFPEHIRMPDYAKSFWANGQPE